jgi:hypothetical protein
MTKMLEKAFKKASSLPAPDQDALAEWLLKEMESEARCQELFAKSQDGLSRLAAEVCIEHEGG